MKLTLDELKVLHVLYLDMDGKHCRRNISLRATLNLHILDPILCKLEDNGLINVKYTSKSRHLYHMNRKGIKAYKQNINRRDSNEMKWSIPKASKIFILEAQDKIIDITSNSLPLGLYAILIMNLTIYIPQLFFNNPYPIYITHSLIFTVTLFVILALLLFIYHTSFLIFTHTKEIGIYFILKEIAPDISSGRKIFNKIISNSRKKLLQSITLVIENTILNITSLLPDKQDQYQNAWLAELDEIPRNYQKSLFTLSCFQITLILQRKRLLKYLAISSNQKSTLMLILFTFSLLFSFQAISALSAWFITHNLIITSLNLSIFLQIFSSIYRSTTTHSTLSNITPWSLLQISLLTYIFVFKANNPESQLLLFSLLALHTIFFQPLFKEITALLQKWRELGQDRLSEK